MRFTAIFQKVPEGFIGFVEELPGANTQGATLDEVRNNLNEAVELVLEGESRTVRRVHSGATGHTRVSLRFGRMKRLDLIRHLALLPVSRLGVVVVPFSP